ncbi:hypothetical protein ILYODFUR_020413 [Ilyodon furcidens]|uniref:Uncharacterized protein n=1 Tax=Ilyodon furcidens TaxID=33524 RepID=A0ABV0TBH4_9TELE
MLVYHVKSKYKVLKFKKENVKKSRGKNNLARSTFPHLIFQRTPQTSPNMQWKSFRKCYLLSSIEAENLNLILKQPLSQTPPSLTCNKLSFLLFDSSSFWSQFSVRLCWLVKPTIMMPK